MKVFAACGRFVSKLKPVRLDGDFADLLIAGIEGLGIEPTPEIH